MKRFPVSQIRKMAARRPEGYVETVLAAGTVEDGILTLTDEAYRELAERYRAAPKVALGLAAMPAGAEPEASGVGEELARILGALMIKHTAGCKCEERAKTMDEMGPAWCRENRGLILDWMQEEAGRRGLPFLRLAADFVLERAILRVEQRLAFG